LLLADLLLAGGKETWSLCLCGEQNRGILSNEATLSQPIDYQQIDQIAQKRFGYPEPRPTHRH
jgi:hypothetical protein